MKISEAIRRIKSFHYGIQRGNRIDEEKTRDKVLYGDPEQELTGIVTTCFASVEVIKKAIELNANLIICHEALFWNHGDRTDWLQDNQTFQAKVMWLKKGNIVVWRDHDYIHSGIQVHQEWVDGIFYGIMKELGWEDYFYGMSQMQHAKFKLPQMTVRELCSELMKKLPLNGIKIVGSLENEVSRVWIPGHIGGIGPANETDRILATIEEEQIDTVICFELMDTTVAEYVRDSNQIGRNKTILAVGHFNMEEPGMKTMIEYLPEALHESVKCTFVASTDMYNFAFLDPLPSSHQ